MGMRSREGHIQWSIKLVALHAETKYRHQHIYFDSKRHWLKSLTFASKYDAFINLIILHHMYGHEKLGLIIFSGRLK